MQRGSNMKAVKIHCGSAHVKGSARNYRYVVASLFEVAERKSGGHYWKNTGISTTPRRSDKLAQQDALELAAKHGADFIDGYGSLHGQPAEVCNAN